MVSRGHGAHLAATADRIEALLPQPLSRGPPSPSHSPAASSPLPRRRSPRFMSHMTEPLPHFYRPLAFYAGMEGLAWVNHCMLWAAGYRLARRRGGRGSGGESGEGGVGDGDGGADARWSDHYYYVANMPAEEEGGVGPGAAAGKRRGPAAAGQQQGAGEGEEEGQQQGVGGEGGTLPPIVFLHGVGMGLQPYLRLLVALAATGGSTRVSRCVLDSGHVVTLGDACSLVGSWVHLPLVVAHWHALRIGRPFTAQLLVCMHWATGTATSVM